MRNQKRRMYWGLLLATALLNSGQAHSATGVGFRSLNDLPSRWSGVAGDLFVRNSAKIEWSRAREVSRQGTDQNFVAEYSLTGEVQFGELKYQIVGAQFWVQDARYQRAEVTLKFDDPLVKHINAVVRLDSSTGRYDFSELPRNGTSERRYVLTPQ